MKWSFAVFIGDPASRSFFRPGQGRMPTGESEAQGPVDRLVSELRSSHRGFDVQGGGGYTRVGERFTFDAPLSSATVSTPSWANKRSKCRR